MKEKKIFLRCSFVKIYSLRNYLRAQSFRCTFHVVIQLVGKFGLTKFYCGFAFVLL